MQEKFERVSLSAKPEVLEKLRKQAELENVPLSRLIVNSAMAGLSKKEAEDWITQDGLKAALKAWEPILLEDIRKELKEIEIQELEKKVGSEDIGKKLHDIQKSKQWQADVARLDDLKKEKHDEELKHFFGRDGPVEEIDGYSILHGKRTIDQYRQECEKAETQELKKILKK
jgi:hypothetical protein